MAERYSSDSNVDSDCSASSMEVDLDLLGYPRGQQSPPPELMAAINPRALQVARHESTQAVSPEVIAISSDDDDGVPTCPGPAITPAPTSAPGPSTSTANSQVMALMPFRPDNGPAPAFAPMTSRNVPPNLNSAASSVAASGDEIGDELYRSAIHIVLNQVINPGTTNNMAPTPNAHNEHNRHNRLDPDDEPRAPPHAGLAPPPTLRHFRAGKPSRPAMLRVTTERTLRQELEHLMSSSSSSESGTASGSGSATDSGSDANEETESDTEVDEQDESPWFGANGRGPARANPPISNGFYSTAGSASAISGAVAALGGPPPAPSPLANVQAARANILQSMPSSALMGCNFELTLRGGTSSATPTVRAAAPAQKPLLDILWHQQQEEQRLKDEAEKEKDRQERLATQVKIELQVPRVPLYSNIEVTTTNGTKLKANFPEVATIEAGAKSPRKPPKPLTKIVHGHDPSMFQQAVKHHEESLEAIESLKKFQTTSILHARWLPDRHKAEVTLRRGKLIETMGSATNPTMLEFYEALYLLERAKLYLTCPDGVPMSVFDAYATLLRDEADHELHLVFEYLVEGGCTVVPYKKPPKRRKPAEKGSTEGDKLLLAAQCFALPTASSQSAFAKDSDSDLEIISCNMPLPDNKDKTQKEIELVYSPGAIYEGEPIPFVRISCAGQSLILPTIPSELSPACAASESDNINGANGTVVAAGGTQPSRVFVAGRSLTIPEEWLTLSGRERVDRLDEASGEYRELSPQTRGRQRKRKGDSLTPRKGAAAKRGKKAKQQAAIEAAQMHSLLQQGPVTGEFAFPPGSIGVTPNVIIERFHRRWYPRWFDGLELGVHSSSVQSTLHRFTRDGIPVVPTARNWLEFKQSFAQLIAEGGSDTDNGSDQRSALYRGLTKPLMTGTKGNMTSLIFEELTIGKEVTEDLAILLESFDHLADDDEDGGCTQNGNEPEETNGRPHTQRTSPTEGQQGETLALDNPSVHDGIKVEETGDDFEGTSPLADSKLARTVTAALAASSLNGHLNGTLATTSGSAPETITTDDCLGDSVCVDDRRFISGQSSVRSSLTCRQQGRTSSSSNGSNNNGEQLERQHRDQQRASERKSSMPRIVFDVYTDSDYSKSSPSLPDFRVVKLPNGAKGVLKFRDLVRLSVEADDTTLLVAHVVDGRVRARQVMPFSIPRYN